MGAAARREVTGGTVGALEAKVGSEVGWEGAMAVAAMGAALGLARRVAAVAEAGRVVLAAKVGL